MNDPLPNRTTVLNILADLYGCPRTEAALNRAVYQSTACGAWCVLDDQGLRVGVVAWSEAEFSIQVLLSDDPEVLKHRFRLALQRCEAFVDQFAEETPC